VALHHHPSKSRYHKRTILGQFVAFQPSLRHRLGFSVKPQPLHTVLVDVAKGRAFPAAEAVIGHGDGDGDIDADHADFNPVSKLTCGAAIGGVDRDAVAVLVFARQL